MLAVVPATAAAQSCPVLPAPPASPPAASKPQTDRGPLPEPPADFKATLAAMTAAKNRGDEGEASRLLAEARRLFERWSTAEIRARYEAGMTQAGTPTKEPPPQIREIIHIDRLGEPLGIGGNAMDRVRAIVYRWAETRLPVVRSEGMALAERGGAATPPQVAEAIAIDRDVQTVASGDAPSAASQGAVVAREIFSAWASVRMPQLRDAGLALAAEGRPTAPAQIGELLRIGREAAQLPGDTPSLASIADGAMPLVKEIVVKWVDVRAERLVAAGRPAADAGGPTTPAQVDQLLAMAREVECVDQLLGAGAAERVRAHARTLAERHLAAHRAKLSCPIAAPPRAGYARLVSSLTARGWGPYQDLPSCTWKGTIVWTRVSRTNQSRTGPMGGQNALLELDAHDSVVVRIDVADGRGQATVSGRGRSVDHQKFLAPACSPLGQEHWKRATTTFAGGGVVPVTVEQVGSGLDYLIQFSTPAYESTKTEELEWTPSASCPLGGDGGKKSSVAREQTSETSWPIRDTAIPLASLTGGDALGLTLDGSQRLVLKGVARGGGDIVQTTTWKLTRD